jgi:hypothetical protein
MVSLTVSLPKPLDGRSALFMISIVELVCTYYRTYPGLEVFSQSSRNSGGSSDVAQELQSSDVAII